MHPANLALRFFLEIAALSGFGAMIWHLFSGWWRPFLLAVVLGGLMAVWGVFAVPDDPSRSGNAPVPIPGLLRLAGGAERITALKVDCEGCEWGAVDHLWRDAPELLGRVDQARGESGAGRSPFGPTPRQEPRSGRSISAEAW